MFDAIAGRYDFLNHLLSAGIDRRWRQRAIRSLRLTGGERVLDLCTGTGDLAIAAARARPAPARVIGIDFAAEMLRIAKRKLVSERLTGRAIVLRGDATCIPIATASADAVTVAFGIRNVADVPAACREIRRVLKPGGRVAILEFAVPTVPAFRQVYLWYIRRVLPQVGRVVSRHEGAYRYLQTSIDAFITPAEFVTILRQCGFVEIHPVPLSLGCVFLYAASRESG
jgi:demethylmenaquinone methyltransferase/2-methoxy-6-polyprenyl-1,4-benzoquinol methylase